MGKESRCERARRGSAVDPMAGDGRTARPVKRRVLVAFEDVGQRIDVAACLMLAGHDVVLARSLDQKAGLIGAVHIVVADGRLASGLGRRAHEALRQKIFIAACEPGVPTPLIARVRLASPLIDEEIVTAVSMLAASAPGTRANASAAAAGALR